MHHKVNMSYLNYTIKKFRCSLLVKSQNNISEHTKLKIIEWEINGCYDSSYFASLISLKFPFPFRMDFTLLLPWAGRLGIHFLVLVVKSNWWLRWMNCDNLFIDIWYLQISSWSWLNWIIKYFVITGWFYKTSWLGWIRVYFSDNWR